MRLGLDVAQQRTTWQENVARVQFAEELGFDGVWGFDHFQPMYGEGPGECFEGQTTLAAWRIGAPAVSASTKWPSDRVNWRMRSSRVPSASPPCGSLMRNSGPTALTARSTTSRLRPGISGVASR